MRARLLRAAGRCGEPLYRSAIAARNAAFDRGWRKIVTLPRPVISVGNITTGGTGKTPMVIHLARQLLAAGRSPAILTRGYRAERTGFSDEARLFAEAFGESVPVGVGADRVAAAERLLRDHPEIDVFVLDDGFQHRRVHRDLDLVLVDATNPFGYGHVLPRGLLREPVGGLRRADAVIVTRAEQLSGIAAADELERQIVEHHGKPPLAWFAHRWAEVIDADGNTVARPPSLADSEASGGQPDRRGKPRVLAFTGIGSPAGFLNEAMRWFDVAGHASFDDHHAYTAEDLTELAAAAEHAGADVLLTTQKDWVKLVTLPGHRNMPIWRPCLALECMRGESDLAGLLGARAAGHVRSEREA